MFACAMISFSVLSLPLLAAAVALPDDGGDSGYNYRDNNPPTALCSSGSAQCCDSTYEVSMSIETQRAY